MLTNWIHRGASALLLLALATAPATALAQLDIPAWNTLLLDAVSDGYVDYTRWADDPRFDALIDQVAQTDTGAMNREQKLVFYINAYNILAACGILDCGSPEGLIVRHSFDVEQRKAVLSSIFKWFEMDFVEAAGSLQAYLAQFVEDEKAVDLLERDAFEVGYLRYDWSLNGKR